MSQTTINYHETVTAFLCATNLSQPLQGITISQAQAAQRFTLKILSHISFALNEKEIPTHFFLATLCRIETSEMFTWFPLRQ